MDDNTSSIHKTMRLDGGGLDGKQLTDQKIQQQSNSQQHASIQGESGSLGPDIAMPSSVKTMANSIAEI